MMIVNEPPNGWRYPPPGLATFINYTDFTSCKFAQHTYTGGDLVHALLGAISREINLLSFNLTHHQELEDVRLREYLCKHHRNFGIRSRPPVHIRYQY
jgi:hypothetical protein